MKKLKIYFIHIIVAYAVTYVFFQSFDLIDYTASTAIGLFLLVYFLLWILSWFYSKSHFKKLPKIVSLIFFFIKELIVASLKIAYDVLTPKFILQPAVIALPLDADSDLEITILASLISLTPGTLSIDVTEDRKILYIHVLYSGGGETDTIKKDIKNGFEKRILAITRG